MRNRFLSIDKQVVRKHECWWVLSISWLDTFLWTPLQPVLSSVSRKILQESLVTSLPMPNTFNSSLLSINKIKKAPPFHSSIKAPSTFPFLLPTTSQCTMCHIPAKVNYKRSFLLSIYQSLHSDRVPKWSQSCKKNVFPMKRVFIILGPPLTSLSCKSIFRFSVLVRQSTSFNTKEMQCELIANGIVNIMKN